MSLNCDVGEGSWESIGLPGNPTSPPKGNQSWIFIGRTDVEAETPVLWPPPILPPWGELTHWKRPWCWERLKVGGAGDDRGWDGWMTSPTRWKWVWVSSRSWWWTRKPGVLQSTGSQRVGHNWVTELNWTELKNIYVLKMNILRHCCIDSSRWDKNRWIYCVFSF